MAQQQFYSCDSSQNSFIVCFIVFNIIFRRVSARNARKPIDAFPVPNSQITWRTLLEWSIFEVCLFREFSPTYVVVLTKVFLVLLRPWCVSSDSFPNRLYNDQLREWHSFSYHFCCLFLSRKAPQPKHQEYVCVLSKVQFFFNFSSMKYCTFMSC